MSTLAAFHLAVRNVMMRYLMSGVTSPHLRIVCVCEVCRSVLLINVEDDNSFVEKMPNAARKLIKKLDPLEIHDNLLCYRVNDEHRTLVIPERQQRDVAQFYHDQGHFNARKVKHLIERNCAWTNMTATIEDVVKHCERCQKRKTPKVATRCDLKRLKVKHGPMAQLNMDFLNIDCRRDTKFKVLTVVDDFTKFI